MTHPIFIGGTSSHAGKSWMATAICAFLRRQGYRVAPFKAQNMSNNSYPCRAGGEIGRAQVAQARACGLEPEPAMNPILLKPQSEGGSQVVVNGKVWKTLAAREYYEQHAELLKVVLQAYESLASRFDVLVIEGAGSVSELNLRQYDLVNLRLVTQLSAPWLLVGDIERGGIFASILGTIALLNQDERALLRAFAVNKFLGDLSLFDEGRSILEQRTGCPCLGVMPYAKNIYLDDEDSLSIPEGRAGTTKTGATCAILRFPHISNTTDFREIANPSWIARPSEQHFDFIFLPGTKNTISDLSWLRSQNLDSWLRLQHQNGSTLIGICGGFQMLGETIEDPFGMETSVREATGLGFILLKTVLARTKTTCLVDARTPGGNQFKGYEIHLGESQLSDAMAMPFAFRQDGSAEGIRSGRIIGTYLHGAFEDDAVLSEFGIPAKENGTPDYSKLADWFEPFGERFLQLFL